MPRRQHTGYAKPSVRDAYGSLIHPGRNTNVNLSLGGALKLFYKAAIIPFILFVIVGTIVYMSGVYSCPSVPANIPVTRSCGLTGLQLFGGSIGTLAQFTGVPIAAFIVGILVIFLAVPFGILVDSALFHLIGKVFLNTFNNDYEKSFSAVMFGTMPAVVFYWILLVPIAKLVFLPIMVVWQIIVLTIALANQQKITRLQSFAVILSTSVIVTAVVMLALMFAILGVYNAANPTPLLPVS